MALRFHNQLTKRVDDFVSQTPNLVKMYTCGPTVYDYAHIGNWSGYIYWDILVRVLQAHGYKVDRVMNITDVGHLVSDADEGEDKLEKGARRENKTAWDVAKFYTDNFLEGMKKLGLIEPTHISKATDYIDEQLELVRELKQKGYTYQISDGIYYDTSKFSSYADFAGLNLTGEQAGARVEFNPEKRNVSDFALWKFTPAGEKRDMEWETPADLMEDGQSVMGFPGWHLECSAMAISILGNTLDIHTGGIDHIPVHHTNEIAQSEAVTGERFSNYWLHNNHLKSNGTKISKSLGNGYTLEDLIDKGYEPADLRMFVLQSHYRSEGNFSFDNLEAAKNRLQHWRNVAALRHQTHDTLMDDDDKSTDDKTVSLLAASQALIETLGDDLDTPGALTLIDDAFDRLDRVDDIHHYALVDFLETIDEVTGLNLLGTTPDVSEDVKMLIIERERARDAKDWPRADKLRHEIEGYKINIRDTEHGTVWEYA